MDTLLKLQQDTLRYFDLATEVTGSVDADLVREVINRAHQRRCSENKWRFMLGRQRTLAVTAGTQEYILPVTDFGKMNYLYSVGNEHYKSELPDSELAGDMFTNVLLDANNDSFKFYSITPAGSLVLRQPTVAQTVTLAITAEADENKSFYVEGEDADGVMVSEAITCTDFNVPVASTTLFSRVTYYAKNAEFEGSLTLTATTDATTLISLTNAEFKKEFAVLKFKQTPAQADTLKYQYFRTPRFLTRDRDTFDLPYPHTGILLYDALLDCATYSELDSESVNIWRGKQEEAKQNLYFSEMTSDSVGGISRHTQEG